MIFDGITFVLTFFWLVITSAVVCLVSLGLVILPFYLLFKFMGRNGRND